MPVIKKLKLTPQCSEYYATWVKKSKLSQLKQITDERKLHLRLIAFLQHQHYLRQDICMDLFLRTLQSAINSALNQLNSEEQLTRSGRRSAIRYLTKKHKSYKGLIEDITEVSHSSLLSDSCKIEAINALLKEHAKSNDEKEKKNIELFEKSLDELAKDENYYDILEKLSMKIQNRVSGILQLFTFDQKNSSKALVAAISHFKTEKNMSHSNTPTDFLDNNEGSVKTESLF
jgi:hypothetical protein